MGPGGLQPGNYNASQLTQDQRQWLFNYFGHQGQASAGYGGENAPGEISNYTPGMSAQAIAAQNSSDLGKQQQALYQQQQGSAISGLQTQQGNLAQQYKSLLDSIKSEYDPLINKATTEENNFLGARGLVSNTGAGQTQMNQTLEQIYGQQAGATGQAIQGSISDYNSLAQAIAGIQAGGAGTAAQLPLQYGQLGNQSALIPSQIALNQGQAIQQAGQNPTQIALAQIAQQYQHVPSGDFLLNTANNSYVNPSQLMQILGYAAGNYGGVTFK